jgi:acyl transferase domain-containing protein/NADPH:quinone reductase-like Zn-dependent oxidoreductase/NADP-dependent 3-hydroxy acid dehydrogenase YdfG/acyl carrier protein
MSAPAITPPPMSAVKLALTVQRFRAEGGGMDLLQSDPIAVIGMGCRFPGGANSPDDLWRLLESGTDAIRDIPPERWNLSAYFDPDHGKPGKMYVRSAGFIEDIDKFDAEFFGIAPREAAAMDPQQRLTLEVVWEALNDAGHPPEELSGSSTGVFLAVYSADYSRLQFSRLEDIDAYTVSGTAHGIAAGRLSYLLNLRGPSMAIDTACSSSLVAIHLACQSLRNGECSLAITGGANALLRPEDTISLCKWGVLAPDGRCKTFDASANGFARGEGCGMIVLKRMADALTDGDRIYGAIRGSAVNQDGRSAVLTAPNGLAQQSVLRQALKNARITPDQISYIEAHGTGTSLGDPIEVEALSAVLGQPRANGSTCRLGSIKTNVGHLEAAAGLAGLMKVLLAMKHGLIPPHLHFKKLNPLISLDGTCLTIGHEAVPWPATETTRFAGVSAFGFGGTNAHVILEEPPRLPARKRESRPTTWLLPLSARNPKALADLVPKYARFLGGTAAQPPLADICFTASVRRWHHPARAAFVGASAEELAARLLAFAADPKSAGPDATAKLGKLAFIFSGHGSQWFGMGRALLEQETVFRDAMKKCDAALRSISGWSVLAELAAPKDRSRLDDTEIFQPVLFALQTSLASLWCSWGIVPEAVVGHSLGEIAAAHVAGALKLEDAAKIVVHRGRLMQAASGQDAMTAVEISAAEAREIIARGGLRLCVGAINAPNSITLSGSSSATDEFLAELSSRGISGKRLKVNCAFHSPAMAPSAAELVKLLAGLSPAAGTVPIYSTVTDRLIDGRRLDPDYWGRNILEPVQFAAAVEAVVEAGALTFLEISPHPVLASSLKQCLEASGKSGSVLASLRRGADESATLLASLGSLYALGKEVDWKALYPHGGNCVSLPIYPWQKERHWVKDSGPAESAAASNAAESNSAAWPGRVARSAFFDGVVLEYIASASSPAFANDHRLCGIPALPATGMIDLALSAAKRALSGRPSDESPGSDTQRTFMLENFSIDHALPLRDNEPLILQIGFKTDPAEWGTFRILSRPLADANNDEAWTLHASGSVRVMHSPGVPPLEGFEFPTLQHTQSLCAQAVDVESHYAQLRGRGLEFGPSFRGVDAFWSGANAGLARLRPPVFASAGEVHVMPPAFLDACLQAVTLHFPGEPGKDGLPQLWLPVAIAKFWITASLANARWSFAQIRQNPELGDGVMVADISIFDQAGEVVAALLGLRLLRAEKSHVEKMVRPASASWLYEIHWEPQPLPPISNSTSSNKRVLILADQGGVAGALAKGLFARGFACTFVRLARFFRAVGDGSFEVASENAVDFHTLLKEVQRMNQSPICDVVHLWSLDLPPMGAGESPSAEQRPSFGSALHLAQALIVHPGATPPRLWLITHGASPIPDRKTPLTPAQAPLWGLAPVIAIEHPELTCFLVDLDFEPGKNFAAAAALGDELTQNDGSEQRVALGEKRRFVARLQPMASQHTHTRQPARREENTIQAGENFRLHRPSSGIFEELNWRPGPRRPPGPGEVEIQVEGAGLNFRDVLAVLKVLDSPSGRLGGECAGRIVAVGSGVHEFQVGEEVMAFAPGGLEKFATVSAKLAAIKPHAVTLREVAGVPVVYLTVLYAFRRVTTLRSGQKVLIHAAAGGVGSAAVQLAKLAGAEIFGTAGSPEKRDLLTSWGVRHIFDSRSLAFADQIRALTGGEGVDVVLNSLAGEFAARSLDLVRPGGVFIELGKRDILDPQQVARERPGVTYAAFDLSEIAARNPAEIRSLFEELNQLLESGAVRPLPTQFFPMRETAAAFRHMAQGRHTGKIVIEMDANLPAAPDGGNSSAPADDVCVITGGLGALGLGLARWLVTRGTTRLALIGRRSPDESARAVLDELRRAGARIEVFAADVSDRAQIRDVLARVRQSLGSLRGVIHAAGVLDDGSIMQLDWPRCRSVFAPKMDGGWNMHELTRADRLDYFVLFSSASSLLGWPGQGNYAAANAFLDALAHHRRSLKLPALSVNWGVWGEAGMAANLDSKNRNRMTTRGLRPISSAVGFDTLGELLHSEFAQIAAIPADWPRYAAQFPGGIAPSLVRQLINVARSPEPSRSAMVKAPDFVGELSELPKAQRLSRVQKFVEERAARALGLAPGKQIDPRRPLHELGLDSLMSVELRNALAAALGRSLSATLLFDYPTVASLTRHLAKDILKLDVAERASPPDRVAPGDGNLKDLEKLSESEAESLLLAELNQSKNTPI